MLFCVSLTCLSSGVSRSTLRLPFICLWSLLYLTCKTATTAQVNCLFTVERMVRITPCDSTHSKSQWQAVLFFLYTHVLVNYFTVRIQMSYCIGRAKRHIYSINHLLERKYLFKSWNLWLFKLHKWNNSFINW